MLFSHENVGSAQWTLHWAEVFLPTTIKSHVVKIVITWSICPEENNNIRLVYIVIKQIERGIIIPLQPCLLLSRHHKFQSASNLFHYLIPRHQGTIFAGLSLLHFLFHFQSHTITCFLHQHAFALCALQDNWCYYWNINKRCNSQSKRLSAKEILNWCLLHVVLWNLNWNFVG